MWRLFQTFSCTVPTIAWISLNISECMHSIHSWLIVDGACTERRCEKMTVYAAAAQIKSRHMNIALCALPLQIFNAHFSQKCSITKFLVLYVQKKSFDGTKEAFERYYTILSVFWEKKGKMWIISFTYTGMVSRLKPQILFPLLIHYDQCVGGRLATFWGDILQEGRIDLHRLDNSTQNICTIV